MSRKNPTSSIRSGFDFQTGWAIKIIVDWLKQPEKILGIQIETCPSEIDDSKFYLDDILVFDSEGNYQFSQLKYKQHPSDPKEFWTFEKFLERPTKTGTCLFKKWSDSICNPQLYGKIKTAELVTNGYPDEYLSKFLNNNQIDISRLKQDNRDLFSRICSDIGSEDTVRLFFSKFQFHFGQLSIDDLEKSVQTQLIDELKVTFHGFTNLIYNINKISRGQYPERLDIDKIRGFCEFDDPRPLNQEFSVPADFEFYDTSRHLELISDLACINGGVKLIYGKPGIGKSTYLSKLSEKLKETGYLVIKHQYFISANDPDFSERLLPYRVIEAFKAEFKGAKEFLGSLANKNSYEIPLQEFFKQISLVCLEKGKPCILIIDGLDHVVRFKDQEALKALLKEICIPEKGLWVILGTQESAIEYIPLDILSRCPKKDKIEIRGLTRIAIKNIIKKNQCELNLPENDFQLDEFSDKIFELTKGNPLILRFSLQELKNKFGRRIVTAYDCTDILPYSGDIQKYYDQLWQKIGDESKTLLITVSSVSFNFSKDQLTDFLTYCFSDPSKVSLAFKNGSHILGEQDGKYSIFHTSFGLFIVNQDEYQEQKKAIKQKIIDWFQTSDNDELQWTEEKKLYYDLGDSSKILSIDEQWVFDALCYPREIRQIISQVSVANEAAFKERKFASALKFSKIHDYLLELHKYSDEIRLLWNESIKQGNRDLNEILIDDLSPSQLYHYCCELDDLGLLSIYFPRVIKCFNNQLRNLKIGRKSENFESLPDLPFFVVRVMGLNRKYPLKQARKFIKLFDNDGWGDDLFLAYVKELLASEQSLKINSILKFSLPQSKYYKLLIELAKKDLLKNSSDFLAKFKSINQSELPLPCLFYLYLRDCEITSTLNLPNEDGLNVFSTDDGILFEENEAERYSNIFYIGLLFSLIGRNDELASWIENHKSNTNWSFDVIKKLFQICIALSEKVKSHDEIQISDIFCKLSDLPQPKYERFTTNSGLRRAIQRVTREILTIVCILKIKFEHDLKISHDDLKKIQFSPWMSREHFLEWLLEFKDPILSEPAFSEYLVKELEFWKHNIVPFSERAQHYVKLASLCRYHQDQRFKEILKLGARNLLAYGYHKDMFLYYVINSIRICHTKQSPKIEHWRKEIEQPVAFISEYTDGDETRHFPMTYANLLGDINPQLLYKQYFTAIKNEEYDHGEQFFADIIAILDYSQEINISIASTALDSYSFKTLQSLSEEGNLQANQAKTRIENHFGSIVFPEEDTSSSRVLPSKPVQNYEQVSCNNLENCLQSFDRQWDSEEFLDGWIKYHLYQPNPDYKTIYDTVSKIVDKSPSRWTFHKTLDLLYPLAYQFDSEKAFQYVTLAQANSLGWFDYYSDESSAHNRWKFVKDHFPKRYLEFYEKSIFLTGDKRSYPYGCFIPIPRSLDYFILFNRMDLVEEITQSSIDTIKLLMADIEFPTVEWTQYPDVDEFDILLSRLKWPSPLVRERAATEIARLLCDPSNREIIFTKLIEWIRQQPLESLVTIGLLPIIKAADDCPHIKDWLKIDTITKCLPVSSLIIEKLVADLSLILEQPFTIHAGYLPISVLPEGYEIPEKFEQHIRQYLSLIYWENAKKISKKTGFNFVENWAFTSDEIKNNLQGSSYDQYIGLYHGYQHQPQLIGLSSDMSEIYRSAYLRVFEHCYNDGLLSNDDLYLIFSTMPIDLSFWKVKPHRCPIWWPKFNNADEITEKNVDELNTQIFTSLEQSLKEPNEFQILALEGAITPLSGWSGKITSTIKLVGFSYAIINECNIDDPGIAQCLINPPIILLSPSASKPFRLLEMSDQHIENRSPFFAFSDFCGSHLISEFYLSLICQWQWYRFIMGLPIGLSSEFGLDISIKIQDGTWKYYQEDSVITECYDWLEGIRERVKDGEFVPYGKYIQMNSQFLSEYLKANELKIGYAVEIIHDVRKYSHEDPKYLKSYKIITFDKQMTDHTG